MHAVRRSLRPSWVEITQAAGRLVGRPWGEMVEQYGSWGRDGVLAVATRSLGWKLSEAVKELPGLSYHAAAQGIRRFWKSMATTPQKAAFARKLASELSTIQV